MPKKKKGGISSIKRTNQRQTKLRKQGKLKKTRNKKKIKLIPKKAIPVQDVEVDKEEQELEEESQLDDLTTEYGPGAYSFLANAHLDRNVSLSRRKRKLKEEDELNAIEYKFEGKFENNVSKKMRYLLPIKTNEGLITRSVEIENVDNEEEEDKKCIKTEPFDETEEKETKEYSSADLFAQRENLLKMKKFRIGVLCSSLLENPGVKMQNFKPLLDMLDEKNPEVQITVKKLALISLLEIFKDILPEYQIKIHDEPKVKLKKQVKELRDYESNLLKFYKMYLVKIESIISMLKKRRHFQVVDPPQLNLGALALKCVCDLLVAYPYFNYSRNITHLIVPFLNSGMEKVRNIVSTAVKEVFKTDTRGEISLHIVRSINKLVKSKNNAVHPDTILVFLSLKLKDVNLDKEKENEMQKKKLTSKKHKLLKLSKRERKRKKRLQDLEKDLLETKATENKEKKHEYMTEITKLVFMIYFKILKVTPNSKLLNASLEGLAKFAHCINVEFYHDLVNILDQLIETGNLGFKEKLCCVHTVFTILFYQGATIYLDPSRFYSHLYANIIYLNAGKSHSNIPLVLKAIDVVLLKRRKYVSLQRLLAFTKRLSLLTLQVLPNGALALLSLIREILQVNNSTDVLLDVDSSVGQGVYYPEMNEPEYCNAGVSTLWELLALQRHYHPTVQEYAKIAAELDRTSNKSLQSGKLSKLSCEELYKDFDPSEVRFNPSVPIPKNFPRKKHVKGILSDDLADFVRNVLSKNVMCDGMDDYLE